jgi:murein DD-endopeptidase MepM/ murein hydrolase activator NlpD
MYEIQFHPADIRKPVRYFFLKRSGARWIGALLAVLTLFLAAGVVLAPLGIQSLLLSSDLRRLSHMNSLHLEVLAERIATLEQLQQRVDGARSRQEQISLILGTPQADEGLGGTPTPQGFHVSVPEANTALAMAARMSTQTQALLTLAEETRNFADERHETIRTVPSICPLPIGSFVLTSPFGERVSPFTSARDFHTGLDLAAREGTPVFASGDARVVFAGRFPRRRNIRWWRYGNVVVLRHGEGFLTIYAHLQDISVKRGNRVKRGAEIGTVGNTGWSTSPHLHYEVRVIRDSEEQPVPVDPRIYILDYQWTGHESVLIAGRTAPTPDFDPLPRRFMGR